MEINQELANKFYALADKIEAVIQPNLKVDMMKTKIYGDIEDERFTGKWARGCGTVGCAAGWIAVALCCAAPRFSEGYTRGAEAANKYFGFPLNEWAKKNHRLWGNRWGENLWSAGLAWGETSAVFTPDKLVAHLRGVAKRIEAEIGSEFTLSNPAEDKAEDLFLQDFAEDKAEDKIVKQETGTWDDIPEVMEVLEPIMNKKSRSTSSETL